MHLAPYNKPDQNAATMDNLLILLDLITEAEALTLQIT